MYRQLAGGMSALSKQHFSVGDDVTANRRRGEDDVAAAYFSNAITSTR